MSEQTIEILAPAGSYSAFQAAIHAGADAVYAGGMLFGARAFAENFSEDELIRAIREAHLYGRRLYMTVNTLLKESEIECLYDYLMPYYENGLDAVIVQDFGAVEYIRQNFPGLDIHASTQMTVTDAYGAAFVRDCGITRVVPARELSLDEIRLIRSKTGLEIECFVHGALCYCYSGQCLLSSMIGGRSGNRGRCAQPCRLPYSFEASADKGRQYYLSPKDICTLDLIPDLIEAGINSFKIEGRMKSPEYVAGVTAMYRKYTDLYLKEGRSAFPVQPEDRENLMDLYNRGGFSEGYYNIRNGRKMISLARPNHAGVPAARIIRQSGREVYARALTELSAGDVLEIAGEKNDHTTGSAVKKGHTFSFLVRKQVRLQSGTTLRRIRNGSLLKRINDEFTGRPLQRPVSGILTLRAGSPALLELCSGEFNCTAVSDEPVQHALNRPLTAERIRAQLNKTGTSVFCFSSLDIIMDDDIFMPVQQLSALRRKAFDFLESMIVSHFYRTPAPVRPHKEAGQAPAAGEISENRPFSIYVQTSAQFDSVLDFTESSGIYPARIYLGTALLTGHAPDVPEDIKNKTSLLRQHGTEIITAMPHILRSTEYPVVKDLFHKAGQLPTDGFLVRNCGEFRFLQEHGFDKKVILDHNLYVCNRYAADFWKSLGIKDFTEPLEPEMQEPAVFGPDGAEVEIYGAAPVMVSAQCLFKTAEKCRKDFPVSMLTDRRGKHFPVCADCDFCYNVIYHSQPNHIPADTAADGPFHPRFLRIRFSTESPDRVTDILREYLTD